MNDCAPGPQGILEAPLVLQYNSTRLQIRRIRTVGAGRGRFALERMTGTVEGGP